MIKRTLIIIAAIIFIPVCPYLVGIRVHEPMARAFWPILITDTSFSTLWLMGALALLVAAGTTMLGYIIYSFIRYGA